MVKRILSCQFLSSVIFFQGEDGLGWFTEVTGYLQRQDGRGDISAGFYGIDGLPAHADSGGEILLGDVFYRPFNFHCVFHRADLLMLLIVMLNLRI